ncbi:MAG: hypothetical protein IPF92_25145 [Myxococcales bacterium]|nr:hypothetical protein [Myxococcales bacterium]
MSRAAGRARWWACLAAASWAGLAGCDGPRVPALTPRATPPAAVPSADPAVPPAGAARAGTPGPSPQEKRIAAILRRASEARGLAALRPVPGVVLERTELVAAVRRKANDEYPPAALERDARVVELMGFAPTPFDYLKELSALLEAQLDGFYEPKTGTMYVAADLTGDTAQLALSHELVHALQDQHFDLKKRSGYHPGMSDQVMAGSLLAEGDATSAMLDVMMRPQGQTALDLPEAMFTNMLMNAMNVGEAANAPRFLRSTLVFPYVEGTLFVHALRREGGFARVDEAWRSLPTSTEQVLHPAKWASHEPALVVPAPTATALGPGFARVDEDTTGEGGLLIAFEEWARPADARAAAAGWGGDRTGVFSRGAEWANAELVVYDKDGPAGDGFAKRAFEKMKPGIAGIAGPGGSAGRIGANDASFVCVERPALGPLALARRGRALALLAGPAERSGSAVWTPKATCASTRKWADEVLAQGATVR